MSYKLLFFSLIVTYAISLSAASNASDTIPVTTQPIHKLIIFPKMDAPATAISLNDAVLSAEINGVILSFPKQVGDQVKKGDPLAFIQCHDYQLIYQQYEAQLQQTDANITFTKWQLNQAKSLVNQNNISKERLKELETHLRSLQATRFSQNAQLKQADLNRDRCCIKAPFDGIIVNRLAHIGEMATSGRHLIHLVDQTALEVTAQLQPTEILKLQTASESIFVTKEGTFPVKVRSAVEKYNEQSRTQEVRCVFTGNKPLPGAVGRLVWQENQPYLPSGLLSQVNTQKGIFIAENKTAHFIPVENAIEGRPIPLPLKLKGDIILDGRYRVTDGVNIFIQNPDLT